MSEVTDHTFIFLYMTIETPTIGEILKQEFLDPLNITPYRLAKELHVATSTILDILHDRRKLSVEMALRVRHSLAIPQSFGSTSRTSSISVKNVQSLPLSSLKYTRGHDLGTGLQDFLGLTG